jgi:cation transport regulator ChaB
MPKDRRDDIPPTVQRSLQKAQRTFARTLESAEEQYEDDPLIVEVGGDLQAHRKVRP